MWLKANSIAIGDALFLSTVAHHVKKQRGEFVGVMTGCNELFDNNPDVDQVLPWQNEIVVAFPSNEIINPLRFLDCSYIGPTEWIMGHEQHILQFYCKKVGLIPPTWEELRCYIYLTDKEVSIIEPEKYITIHTGISNWNINRLWYGFKELVQLIKGNSDLLIYQLMGPGQEEIPACDKHLRLSLREVCAYIKGAKRHICLAGGTKFMASGVGTKSVVIYGGNQLGNIMGFCNNINIESFPPCAPCWLEYPPCPYGFSGKNGRFHKPCLEMITPEMVWEQIKADLSI